MIGQLPRNVLIGFAVLLWAALAAAWLVPPVLNWNHYRGAIAAFVSDQLGENLMLNGSVRLVLLPQPLLVAEDVTLSDAQDGTSLRAAELRLRVAFWPLLTGRVDAQELVLRGLDVRTGWPLGSLAGQLHAPSWLHAISARVEDGHVQIGNAELHHLNAAIGLLPEAGGISLNGTTEIGGLAWRITGHLTQPGGDGTAGLSVALDGKDGATANFNGRLAANGGLGGKLAVSGPNLSLLLPAPALAFRAEAVLDFASDEVKIANLNLDFAGNVAHGTARYRARHLDMALTANRLDLDAWLPFMLHGETSARPPVGTSVEISVEAATLAGANMRKLHSVLDITPEQIVLRDTTAILPGEANLALSGQLRPATAASDLHFDGSISLTAPALRDTLAWAQLAGQIDLSALPDIALHSANLRAALVVDGGARPVLAFNDLNGLVDDTHLQGNLTLRPGARLGIAAKLDLDRVRLADITSATPFSLAGLPGRFGRLDFDVQLHANEVALGQRVFAPVTLDAALEPGKFSMRRMEAQSPGARLGLSGSVAADGRLSDGRLDVSLLADAQADLLTLLPATVAKHIPPERLSVSAQGAGLPKALALRVVADFGDLHAELQPVLNLTDGTWISTLGIRHPGAPRLIEAFGWPNPVDWLGSGSLSLTGSLSGTGLSWPPQNIATTGLDLAAGQLRANLALRLVLGATPSLSGRISAEALPLLLPALRGTEPLPLDLLDPTWQAQVKLDAQQVLVGLEPLLQQLSTQITLKDGTLKLDGITAKLEQGNFAGRASLASATPPTLQADLTLTGAHLADPILNRPLDLASGALDASLSFSASGYAPQTMLATLDGTLKLSQRDGSLLGLDLARIGPKLDDADLHAALADGSTAIDRADITATLHNGGAQFGPSYISAPSGRVDISGLYDLVGRTQEMHLIITPALPNPPALGLRVSGNVASPTRTPELAEAARWRAEHLPPPDPLPAVITPAPIAKPPAKPATPAPKPPKTPPNVTTAPAARPAN